MPTFGVLKGDLIASLAELVHTGTATSGSASTLVDTNSLNYPDDHLNDMWVYIYGGTGAGQERRILDFVQSTKTTVISIGGTSDWVTNPDNTSLYYVYRRRFNNLAYEAAFKQALRFLRQYYLLPMEDTGASNDMGDPGLAATYSMTVPSGMVAIFRIVREDPALDGVYNVPLPGPNHSKAPWWSLSQHGTTYKVVFDRDAHLATGFIVQGRNVKFIGQQYQAEPTSDASTITINPAPLIQLAAHLLSANAIGQADLAYIWLNRLTRIFQEQGSGVWPASVIVELS